MPDIKGKSFERTFSIERLPEEQRGADTSVRFRASLSSETPVRRFYGDEVLVHDEDSINLERANGSGLMLLYNHDVDRPVGRAKNVQLSARRRLEAELEFSRSLPGAEEIERAVADGSLDDVSIRYSVDDYRLEEDSDGNETLFVTRWTPQEVSIVTVPADYAGSGIGRSLDTEAIMPRENAPDTAGNQGGDGRVNVVEFEAARSAAIQEGTVRGAAIERERIRGIDELFVACRYSGPQYDALKSECIVRGSSVDQTRAAIFDLMNREPEDQTASRGAPDSMTRSPRVEAGEDESDKFLEGASRAVEFKAGIIQGREVSEEMAKNEFGFMSMPELAREYLRRSGIDTRGMSRYDVVGYALRPDQAPRTAVRGALMGHGPSDFANLLANTAGKSLLMGFNETEETWQAWTRTGTLPDFKRQDRVNMSNFGDLDEIPSGGAYAAGTMSDLVEYISAKKYGKKFGVYREALINDDLDGLSRAPRAMGRAAARIVGDKVYAILTGNPTLNQDATTLFHANHSNIGTSGAPSITTLDEARQLMALQSDPSDSSHGLNIRPVYLIVPVALETTARNLMMNERDPAEGTTTSFYAPNPFRGAFTVVSDPRLDAASSSAWYMAASPTIHDTVEVGFVNGQQEPTLESRDGWDVDGIEYKTRIEFGVAPLDFRGLVYNAG